MRSDSCLFGATLFLVLAAGPLAAQGVALESPGTPSTATADAIERDASLYQADVSMASQGESERRVATAQALGLVMVKVTGNSLASNDPVVRRAMASASSQAIRGLPVKV